MAGYVARLDRAASARVVRVLGVQKPVGRPVVVSGMDAALVVRLRAEGRSWAEIAAAHPPVRSASGRRVKPSVGSIRRAFESAARGS